MCQYFPFSFNYLQTYVGSFSSQLDLLFVYFATPRKGNTNVPSINLGFGNYKKESSKKRSSRKPSMFTKVMPRRSYPEPFPYPSITIHSPGKVGNYSHYSLTSPLHCHSGSPNEHPFTTPSTVVYPSLQSLHTHT